MWPTQFFLRHRQDLVASGSKNLVLDALAGRAKGHSWSISQWSTLFQQARASGVLLRVTNRLTGSTLSPACLANPVQVNLWPAAANKHLESAQRIVKAQRAEVDRELGHLRNALSTLPAPILLLKGAAYVAADLPAAAGRVFTDIDIMVPKAHLRQAESLLMLGGWITTHHNEYDQRYYRQWMHELPPMQHIHRRTVLDVHHTILPETARLRPDPAKLFAHAVVASRAPGFHVLAPVDMVLHSMTHLFMNEDLSHALRDLSDLDLLIRGFGNQPAEAEQPKFFDSLIARAVDLDLQRPLFYGLTFTHALLDTPVPAATLAALTPLGPRGPTAWLMLTIWRQVFTTSKPADAGWKFRFATLALYVRGHWLRMPPLLLLRHLTVKALKLHAPTVADPAAPPRR
jgi:Uncharacterised nucleotidyltransferase